MTTKGIKRTVFCLYSMAGILVGDVEGMNPSQRIAAVNRQQLQSITLLQSENARLTGEKNALTDERNQLIIDKTALEGEKTQLTNEKDRLAPTLGVFRDLFAANNKRNDGILTASEGLHFGNEKTAVGAALANLSTRARLWEMFCDGVRPLQDNEDVIDASNFGGANQILLTSIFALEQVADACQHDDAAAASARKLNASYIDFCALLRAPGKPLEGKAGAAGSADQRDALVTYILDNDLNDLNDFVTSMGVPPVTGAVTDDLHGMDNVRWHLMRALAAASEFGDVAFDGTVAQDGPGYTFGTLKALGVVFRGL
ncbi:MAG: hypothetical protein LBQ08_05120 [Holosporaceae bacterium]|jgi:FtsZ-binding cell division protein ZapB|nr:hypothetical protein [Holosporaceae bacterium]